jgi:hypothetical protein
MNSDSDLAFDFGNLLSESEFHDRREPIPWITATVAFRAQKAPLWDRGGIVRIRRVSAGTSDKPLGWRQSGKHRLGSLWTFGSGRDRAADDPVSRLMGDVGFRFWFHLSLPPCLSGHKFFSSLS